MSEERLQKILSACGYGSRRDCEKLISAQIVTINGKIAKLGDKAIIETDKIRVDGQIIQTRKDPKVYIALNKPKQILSDIKKQDDRQTVIDLVDHAGYLFIVGRLDYMSEGLILLTNDGELANRLTHPRYEHEKEYRILLTKKPTIEQLHKWREGVRLENGYKTMSADVDIVSNSKKGTWLSIILREGKKRQIREVGRQLRLSVKRIIRIRIGSLELGNLASGNWRYLEREEIIEIRKAARL